MFRHAHILISIVFTVATISARAEDGSSNQLLPTTPFAQPPGSYSNDELKRMSEERLEKVRDELNAALNNRHQITMRADQDADIEHILVFRRFQTQEAVRAVIAIFNAETKRATKKLGHWSVFTRCLEVLGTIGTSRPSLLIEEYQEMIKEFRATIKREGEQGKAVDVLADHVLELLRSRNDTLIDVNEALHALAEKTNTPRTTLARAEKILNERIIGQPEVVEALLDLEWRNALFAKSRTLPDAIYLMGAPGTGKDTAAEAFTDAVNGYEGAYKRHMFAVPVATDRSMLWQLLGSSTGYIGSDNFPPFLQFLVDHSGGKYMTEQTMGTRGEFTRVVENPEYRGETLPGYTSPNKGIVFLNEFHNWSKIMKDEFVKQALEKGKFTINNPNGGLAEIEVPIRFIFASNEGVSLTSAREANGQRFGKPLSYDQSLAKWEKVHENKQALRNEIMAGNGAKSGGFVSERSPGISEELLNRLQERFLILMRPLFPAHLQQIARLSLQKFARDIDGSPLLGKVNLTWADDVPEVLQAYGYIAEDNARPVKGRLYSLIEEPFVDALRADQLPGVLASDIRLAIELKPDRTRDLVITITQGAKVTEVRRLIRTTTKDIPKDPMTDEQIDEAARVKHRLKANVFGIDGIMDQLGASVMNIENDAAAGQTRPARTIMLNGLSSTGKTETAKQLSRILSKSDDELLTFDFSSIQTLAEFQKRILGARDHFGNAIPSDFMKAYDRANGKLVVAFDELANVRDPDLLKALYDFLGEATVYTFSDGIPRPMGGVIVIITGNVGQEPYQSVPTSVPMEVQMMAWADIAKKINLDRAMQRQMTESVYSPAFVNRVDENNIHYVPPHTYKSLRQLAQLKLEHSLQRIASTESRRGWNVVFPSAEEYSAFIDTVIDEGFSLPGQGRSIEKFISDTFETRITNLLLENKVPSGETVVLKFRNKTDNHLENKSGVVNYDVYVNDSKAPLRFKIKRLYIEKPPERNEVDDLLTAYHEAGHSLVREALLGDLFSASSLSIRPGLTMIGGQWVYYAGLAGANQDKKAVRDRDYVVRLIAVLLAGETAERLVSRGGRSSAGKSNDITRASESARDLILRHGLSEKWGLAAVPPGQKTADYIAGLSDRNRRRLEDDVAAILKEARALAQATIEANLDETFIPLANRLAEVGIMKEKELTKFYGSRQLVDPTTQSVLERAKRQARRLVRAWRNVGYAKGDVEIDARLPVPAKFANIQALSLAAKKEQYAEVPLPERLPVGTNEAFRKSGFAKTALLAAPATDTCESELKART